MGIVNSKVDTYARIPKGSYALKRDFNASTRLTAQHYLWKDALKFNIHPSIPLEENDVRIADVATGNGIWLLDVARGLPSTAKLDGFDISLDQCPPSPWLPSNINLHTWNIYEEPPQEFLGVFDVVHVRLITVAIRNNDALPVLSNLRKLLKPNGYLQWDEIDSIDWGIKTVTPAVHTEAVQRLYGQLAGSDDWKSSMVNTLNENGFDNACLYRMEDEKPMARYWNDLLMSTWDEFAKQVIKKPEASARLSEEAMDQVRDGSAIEGPKMIWVAQKT